MIEYYPIIAMIGLGIGVLIWATYVNYVKKSEVKE